MKYRVCVRGLALVLAVLSGTSLVAQDRRQPSRQLVPQQRNLATHGLAVSPFFEGWYPNSNGTYTLSFGYFNRNREEVVQAPIGPDNFIEPADFNGGQPTVFLRRRQVGVFTVTLPGDFAEGDGRVIWTITANGVTHSVPGRIGVSAYQLSHGAMAMGSLPPMLKLSPDGPELWGPMSTFGDPAEDPVALEGEGPIGSVGNPLPMAASVGAPLTLTVWVADRLDPEARGIGSDRVRVTPGVTWYTHQGHSLVEFGQDPEPDEDGEATTTATFSEPGTYVLRVRVDNFNPLDSTPGDQCCWTNGYSSVTVSP
jgi:hypothetical protein